MRITANAEHFSSQRVKNDIRILVHRVLLFVFFKYCFSQILYRLLAPPLVYWSLLYPQLSQILILGLNILYLDEICQSLTGRRRSG